MTKKFLITRPAHDIITSYLYDFSKDIVKTARNSDDIHVTSLEGEDSCRVLFEKSLVKEAPRLVFLNGHGNRKIVAGYKNEHLLDFDNVHMVKGKIVYALACDSLAELGVEAVKKGAEAYIGYRAKFMLVRDISREGSPSKDKNALPFKNVCSVLILSLLSGASAGKSIEKTKEEYVRLIKSYGTSEDDPYGDTPLIRFALAWNLEFLGMEGNPEASF